MNLTEALRLVNGGKVVRRAAWPAIGTVAPLIPPGPDADEHIVGHREILPTCCAKYPQQPGYLSSSWLMFQTTKPNDLIGFGSPWDPNMSWTVRPLSVEDMLAEDWELVEVATEYKAA